jgi:hypothetical protein
MLDSLDVPFDNKNLPQYKTDKSMLLKLNVIANSWICNYGVSCILVNLNLKHSSTMSNYVHGLSFGKKILWKRFQLVLCDIKICYRYPLIVNLSIPIGYQFHLPNGVKDIKKANFGMQTWFSFVFQFKKTTFLAIGT